MTESVSNAFPIVRTKPVGTMDAEALVVAVPADPNAITTNALAIPFAQNRKIHATGCADLRPSQARVPVTSIAFLSEIAVPTTSCTAMIISDKKVGKFPKPQHSRHTSIAC